MRIGPHTVSRDGPPVVMAEIGVNHDGDLSVAADLIKAAYAAGAAAVKFQLFDAKLLLARQAGLVAYQKKSAKDAAALLKPLQLSPRQMQPLIQQAQKLKMAAVVTPFSVELVAPCVAMGVDAIKLASPDLVNRPLVEAAAQTGLPLILSTGAADLPEVERTVGWLWKLSAADRTILLHCVSAYPTPLKNAALGAIPILRQRFAEIPIGYSDHTTETFTAALAVACGACLLEKHLTLSRTRKGPDHAASLEPPQFIQYVGCAKQAFAIRGPFAKCVQPIEKAVRMQTRQSVVATRSLKAGTRLTRTMLTVKRPGTGIPAADLAAILGRRLAKNVPANSILTWPDLEAQ